MSPVLFIIVGLAAGFIAGHVMKMNLRWWEAAAVGAIGALIGWALLRVLIAVSGLAFGLIGAVAGACLVLWLYRRFLGR